MVVIQSLHFYNWYHNFRWYSKYRKNFNENFAKKRIRQSKYCTAFDENPCRVCGTNPAPVTEKKGEGKTLRKNDIHFSHLHIDSGVSYIDIREEKC